MTKRRGLQRQGVEVDLSEETVDRYLCYFFTNFVIVVNDKKQLFPSLCITNYHIGMWTRIGISNFNQQQLL